MSKVSGNGRWVTINGNHVYIEKGESVKDAFKRMGSEKREKLSRNETEQWHQKDGQTVYHKVRNPKTGEEYITPRKVTSTDKNGNLYYTDAAGKKHVTTQKDSDTLKEKYERTHSKTKLSDREITDRAARIGAMHLKAANKTVRDFKEREANKLSQEFKVGDAYNYGGFKGYSVKTDKKWADNISNVNKLSKELGTSVEQSGIPGVLRVKYNGSANELQKRLSKARKK